ncbi:7745_t:CDS:2 [Rhizophagus irregularis]|nr:7745_t:CDS:2 [Rhizophagus irregularis]
MIFFCRRTSGCMKSANVDFQFLDTQVLEPLVNDEEFVSKEELATARLYFKQPGHVSPTQDSANGRTSGLEVCKQLFW